MDEPTKFYAYLEGCDLYLYDRRFIYPSQHGLSYMGYFVGSIVEMGEDASAISADENILSVGDVCRVNKPKGGAWAKVESIHKNLQTTMQVRILDRL